MFFRNKILSEIKCDSIFVVFFLVSGGRNNLSKKKILTEYSQDSTNKIDFKITFLYEKNHRDYNIRKTLYKSRGNILYFMIRDLSWPKNVKKAFTIQVFWI